MSLPTLLHSTLLIPLLLMITAVMAEQECRYAIGKYRNCTCGVQYRIIEKRCCSNDECLLPQLTTENFTCGFECQNEGRYDADRRTCNCQNGRHGICCHKETPLCGEVYLNHTGEILSPNYPNFYPNNARCIWKISTDPNRRIALGTKDNLFDIEPGSNIYSCTYDFLKVFDGTSDRGKSLGTFCGTRSFRRSFQTVYSLSSSLFVKFSSDFIVGRKGFVLQYSVFFKGQECGPKNYFRHIRGTITSPQYPLNYRPNQRCQYTIELKRDHDLLINFQIIDIKATMDCRYGDYLIASGRKDGKLKHLNAFCGMRVPRPYSISGKDYDHVVLTFQSDQSIEGAGFVLNYRQIPLFAIGKNSTSSN